jgi:hypothetical protein
MMAQLKLMEISSVIKMGDFIKRSHFLKVAEEVCSETFSQWIREAESSYRNLMKSPK